MTAAAGTRVLLVDDDPSSRRSTAEFLESEGFAVVQAANGADALGQLTAGVAAIVTDLVMPRVDGMALLQAARESAPHTPVIMMTGKGSERAAVDALKSGAFHYLTKPVNPDELLSLIRQAVEKSRMASQIAALHERLNTEHGFAGMIGTSPAMRRVFERIRMVADTRSTVLIQGESGTGKELVARALHAHSERSGRPFVAVNCAALPESLIESELFGHEKGAFTGASTARTGKFEAADGGTLFVDEIGEMQLDLQSKLLRAIESRCINPVGGNREIAVDVRIIASTHRDLEARVEDGGFREDLYYRLNVVRITLPPLRERREDIALLTRAFLDEIATENDRPARDLTPRALARITGYDWPGNVRQLRNVIESAVVMSSRELIDVVDLPEPIRDTAPAPTGASPARPGATLSELEKEAILQTLEQTGGNRTQAGKRLGISVRTLQRKLKEYGL